MNEPIPMQDAAVAEVPAPTAGQLLAQMRQAAGVHIAALATTLKVSVDKLEALEADRYDAFSDVVFMRALAAGMCRSLKQDPAPVLALLPGAAPAPLQIDKGINATFKHTGPRGNFGGAAEPPRSRLLGVGVVLLLAAALGVALWPGGVGFDGSSSAQPSGPAAPAAQQADAAPPVAPANPPLPPPPSEPGAVAPSPAAPAPIAAPAAVAPADTASAASDAPAATAAAAAAPQAEATLVLRASAPSWVQVRSSDGAVVLQKILAAGESAPVPGTPPWSVVVGKADVTQVIVRGKPLDLAPLARENVARFEVK